MASPMDVMPGRQRYQLMRRTAPFPSVSERYAQQQQARRALGQLRSTQFRARPFPVPRPLGRPGTEVKCMDTKPAGSVAVLLENVAYQEPAANTGYTVLNVVQQGAAVYNRVGTRVNFKSLQLRLMLSGQTAATVNAILRVVMVYDRQTNGAAPAIATIFSDLSAAGGATTTFHSGLAIANRSRFQVIRDEMVPMSFGGDSVKHYKTYAKGMWPTEYSANNGTIGDVATGAIYLIYSATIAGAAAGLSVSQIACRLRFYD
nr:MAG: putative capsid protein [Arizlama virus]